MSEPTLYDLIEMPDGPAKERTMTAVMEWAHKREAVLREALDKYEQLAQQLHAAAYDDPDMGTVQWEHRLNKLWDEAKALAQGQDAKPIETGDPRPYGNGKDDPLW